MVAKEGGGLHVSPYHRIVCVNKSSSSPRISLVVDHSSVFGVLLLLQENRFVEKPQETWKVGRLGRLFLSVERRVFVCISSGIMPLAMSTLSARELSSSSLVELLARDRNMVLVDVRPFLQFNKAHVKSAVNIPCSPLMLRRLAKAGSLGDYVSPELRDRVFSASTVVLYDEDTADINGPAGLGSPLRIIASSLEPHCSQLFYLHGESGVLTLRPVQLLCQSLREFFKIVCMW